MCNSGGLHDALPAPETTVDGNRLLAGGSPDQALEKFRDIPEAVANTMKVAAMCDITLDAAHAGFGHLTSRIFTQGGTLMAVATQTVTIRLYD